MRRPWLLSLALIGYLTAAPAGAESAVTPLFGSRVREHAAFKAPFATLDFDGDGIPDTVYVVSVAAGSATATLASDVTLVPKLAGDDKPLGAHAAKLALAVVLGRSKRKFLLTTYAGPDGGSLFDGPEGKGPPLSVAKRGSAAFKAFKKQEKAIKNDLLVVGTEAGINTALYWNGKTFVLFFPNEEP